MIIELPIKKTTGVFKKVIGFAITLAVLMAFLPQKLIAGNPILIHTGNACKGDTLKLNAGTGVTKIIWKQDTATIKTGTYTQKPVGYGLTVAGNKAGNVGSDSMHLDYPVGICLDASGNVYVADVHNNRVQKWAPGAKYGINVAGSEAGVSGSDSIHLNNPSDVRVDAQGNIFIADAGNNRVQKWAPGAKYGVTVAGSKTGASGSDSLHFNFARALAFDAGGNLYVTDLNNSRVQEWAVGKNYGITVAGNKAGASGTDDKHLNYPNLLYVDGKNNVYVADQHNHRIQEWKAGTTYGITVAGDSSCVSGSDSMHLYNCGGVFVDNNGNIYVMDNFNDRVQKWAPGASYGITVAGNKFGNSGSDSLHFYDPSAVILDVSGDIYVSDLLNNRIQKWGYMPVNDYYVINTSGSYYATVYYTSGDVVNSDTISSNIPAADAGINVSICYGDSITLGGTAISGHTYSWISNPSGFSSTAANPSATPIITTSYTLTETIAATGCSNSNSITVTVNPLPAASTGSNSSICYGNSVALGSTAIAGDTYSWASNPSGFTYTSAGPSVSPTATTTYYLTEKINATGCSKSDSVTITVNPVPAAITGSNSSICFGNSVALGSTAITGDTYSWASNPSGFTNISSGPTVSPTITTTYYLTEKTTSTGCSKSDSVTVTVNPVPAAFTGSNSSICYGNSAALGGSAITGDSYSWASNPYGFTYTSAAPSVSPTATTTYYLTEKTIATGCSKSDSVIITVNPLPDPYWSVSITNAKASFVPDDLKGKKYLWYFGNNDSSTVLGPVYTYTSDGIYQVRLLVTNTFGCMAEYDSNIDISTTTGITNLKSVLFNLKISPNPFTTNLSITYTLPERQNVLIILTDITGKQIAPPANENQNPGQHIYNLDVTKYNIPAGIYFLQMVAGNESVEAKILRIR